MAAFAVLLIAALGVPVPGTLFLLALGSFVQQGEADMREVLVLSIAAAILGDQLGYLIGRIAGRRGINAFTRRWNGGDAIRRLTAAFYLKLFADPHLAKFVSDPSEPHGQRLGNWVVEKMGGEGAVWSEERAARARCPVAKLLGNGERHVVHDRSSAHWAAWHSPWRPAAEMGQHFKLHDVRRGRPLAGLAARAQGWRQGRGAVGGAEARGGAACRRRRWMRLMFWTAREQGLFRSPAFRSWFVLFIAHFAAVYDRGAPAFAEEAAAWSEDPANVEAYLAGGFHMSG